jgi:hypothetical protein
MYSDWMDAPAELPPMAPPRLSTSKNSGTAFVPS